MFDSLIAFAAIVLAVVLVLSAAIKVVKEYERGVIFRLFKGTVMLAAGYENRLAPRQVLSEKIEGA